MSEPTARDRVEARAAWTGNPPLEALAQAIADARAEGDAAGYARGAREEREAILAGIYGLVGDDTIHADDLVDKIIGYIEARGRGNDESRTGTDQ